MCRPRFFDRLRPLAVLAPHLGRRLVLTQAFVGDLAQQIVFGPGQESHFGHQLGPYPCTRVSTSGDPKRLPRGGGTSSGMVPVASGCSRRHNLPSSALSMPVPTRPA